MTKIRVLLADDHAVLRSGLKLLLESQNDMEVVGEAGDFASTFEMIGKVRVDVLTLDLTMPGGLGLGAIQKIREISPHTRVVVLTMHDDPAYLRTALAMGTAGYVVKSAADTELLSAIRAVYQGRVFIDAQSTTTTGGLDLGISPRNESLMDTLSTREREVLRSIAQGHTNQAVADRLDISVKTVESYRGRLMNKLGLKTRADLTRFAIEHDLLAKGPGEPSM